MLQTVGIDSDLFLNFLYLVFFIIKGVPFGIVANLEHDRVLISANMTEDDSALV